MLLDDIIYHRQDINAIGKEDICTKTPNGMKRRKMTIAGWQLCIKCKDGTNDWVALKDIKNSYPFDLADYAKRMNIYDELAFAWWVPYVQKKREIILSRVKSKYWQRTHKYGIRLSRSVKVAH